MSVSISGTNGLTFGDGSAQNTGGYTGFRNRIINGDMRIDQRNAGASVTPANAANTYTVDRFAYYVSQPSKLTSQQSTTAPVGFKNSLLTTSSSAYSVGTNDLFILRQKIEGFNVADLGFGTASAKTITLSFQVYSSLTGTFGGALKNGASDRAYPFSYTVSSANTWTSISITIAGDITGTWATDNNTGLQVVFGLGAGSTYSGTANAWVSGDIHSVTGATSVVGTNGATFYITGVQLEKGSVATPFEFRPYGTELALCQRYYTKNFNIENAPANGVYSDNRSAIGTIFNNTSIQSSEISFPVTMRTAPSITFFSPSFITTAGSWGIYPMAWGGTGFTASVNSIDPNRLIVGGDVSGATNYSSYIMSGYYTASAEL